jgi:hypothetical protein
MVAGRNTHLLQACALAFQASVTYAFQAFILAFQAFILAFQTFLAFTFQAFAFAFQASLLLRMGHYLGRDSTAIDAFIKDQKFDQWPVNSDLTAILQAMILVEHKTIEQQGISNQVLNEYKSNQLFCIWYLLDKANLSKNAVH